MHNNQTIRVMALLLLCMPVAFTACVKDHCNKTHTYTYYAPVYKSKQDVIAGIVSGAPQPLQHTGKIYVYGKYLLLNEIDAGIHVIDNSEPANPRNVSFIKIPGNMDMAVKDNILYADFYSDLVTIDITNPLQIVFKKNSEKFFPSRYTTYGYSGIDESKGVVVDWTRQVETIKQSCDLQPFSGCANCAYFYSAISTGASSSGTSPIGVGGSMARFTLVNQRLYAVTNWQLEVININDPVNPQITQWVNMNSTTETIYPFQDKLFVGSQTGMTIYSIADPDQPVQAGQFSHATSCDPVITDGDYAYVTLRTGTNCRTSINEMDVVKLNNLTNPQLTKTYPMTNPHGLSKDGDLLFVCDGVDGLKIFQSSGAGAFELRQTLGGMETYDVIAMNKTAIVVAKDGLYQFSYGAGGNAKLLSKIPVQNL